MFLPLWEMEYPHVRLMMLLLTVAGGIATFRDGSCYCHCDRWNSHTGWNVVKADLKALVADRMATGSIYFNLSSELFI